MHADDDDDKSDDTATMLEKQGADNELKRTATQASKLLLLNPEGNLKKSDTEFYGEMFGGGGGKDNSYDLAKRRQQAIDKAKADAEKVGYRPTAHWRRIIAIAHSLGLGVNRWVGGASFQPTAAQTHPLA